MDRTIKQSQKMVHAPQILSKYIVQCTPEPFHIMQILDLTPISAGPIKFQSLNFQNVLKNREKHREALTITYFLFV